MQVFLSNLVSNLFPHRLYADHILFKKIFFHIYMKLRNHPCFMYSFREKGDKSTVLHKLPTQSNNVFWVGYEVHQHATLGVAARFSAARLSTE